MEDSQNPIQPDPLPPKVNIIECPCVLADTKTADNARWTNILKEPITISKGSEIRVASSFIDMRGMDSDIIQFTNSGSQQDNNHTLLTQAYTTNDGYNGKTTSYDYMSRNNNSFISIDPGEAVGGVDFKATFIYSPSNLIVPENGTGFKANVNIADHAIRPQNVKINNGGSNYINGDTFRIATATPADDFTGYIITNDSGGIIQLVFTKNTSRLAPTNPNTLIFTDSPLGSGATFTNTFTTNGYYFSTLIGDKNNVDRGLNYQRGQILTITNNSAGADIALSNQPKFQVAQIYNGGNAITNEALFDQGYNYDKSPVFRWDQTYDINQNFCYGDKLGERTFTKDDGSTITISNLSSHHLNDTCISASTMINRKEDSFAPGIFHHENTDSVADNIQLYSPIIHLSKTPLTGGNFTMTPTNEGWSLTCNNYNHTQNGILTQSNILYAYPIGSAIRFLFKDINSPSDAQQLALDLYWNNTVGGVMFVKSITRTSTSTTLYFSPNYIDYIGAATSMEVNLTSPINTYPPNDYFKCQLFYLGDDDGLNTPPTSAPEIYIFTDANGQISDIDGQASNLNLGVGNRVGMYYRFDTTLYPNSTDRIICLKVDNTGGWNQTKIRGTFTHTDLEVGGRDIELFLCPTNNYGFPGDSDLEQGDRRGFRLENSVASVGNILPVKIYEQGLLNKTALNSDTSIGFTDAASNGLYRNSGDNDSTNPQFLPQLAGLANHDINTSLSIDNFTENFYVSELFKYGTDDTLAEDVFFPASATTFDNGAANFVIKINIANWADRGYNIKNLPTNTTVSMIPYIGGIAQENLETHLETGGLFNNDGTYYYVYVKTPEIHTNIRSSLILGATVAGEMNQNDYKCQLSGAVPNFEGLGITQINVFYTLPLYYNSFISFNWEDGAGNSLNNGAVVPTGQQNFYGPTDINYQALITSNNKIINLSNALKNSYNNGGYYFISRFTGTLTNSTNTNKYQYVNNNSTFEKNIFNNYGCFWLFSQLPSDHYAWRNTDTILNSNSSINYTVASVYNNYTAYSDATDFWSYQPLYKQKNMLINKNFTIASDIAGIWTRSAHSLKGALNPINNTEYYPASQTSLLQNEFIFPVYGSNSIIGPDGLYVKDNINYFSSGGLEPGHCVGKNYLDNNNGWLAGPLQNALPQELGTDNIYRKFFYVFFRTPFTFLRTYDPLGQDTTTPGKPDFTPLTTVNTDATNIGNTNNSVGPPIITGIKSLDGTTMLDAGPTTPKQVAYELGNFGGNTTDIKFGQKQYYPISYCDYNKRSLYPKAKASQYIGSQNIALAFASDISTFTFQYLHTGYTTNYVDGLGGGDNSIRIFYGNRKNGIYNHEALGGLVVWNFCRPDYPLNIFTEYEINNLSPISYPYGLNPLTNISQIGRRFLNKLGFQDADIGINNNLIDLTLNKIGYNLSPFSSTITSLMDPGAGPTTIYGYNTTFYGTTGSDIDSSDSILNSVVSPESLGGLESNNRKITPNIGSTNVILRKWGDSIFYPYSLNTDTNAFQDKAIVRFDNASTYGTVGGLLLSNCNRGMGLPNISGSTNNTDQNTIPRTLNPDCEIYLAYTIACGSSFIQASILPQKLTNAYLVIVSSLMKQTPFYMAKAGFVNAISIINKTFITGDFILSEGNMSFYAQEDMVLSEITTEIRDTQYEPPTTLGTNSTVIYSIIDYNPKPKRKLPTIEQEQEQDYSLLQIVQEHMDYLQGYTKTSPLQELNNNLNSLGVNILSNQINSGDVINALSRQIQFHDIPNLPKKELVKFLQTPEGQTIQQSVNHVIAINQTLNKAAQKQEDINRLTISGSSGGRDINIMGGSRKAEVNDKITQDAIKEVKTRTEEIRKNIPSMFYQSPEPVNSLFPPLELNHNVETVELGKHAFTTASRRRYDKYLDYKEERITNGRDYLTYEEFQHFTLGNVLTTNEEVAVVDRHLLPENLIKHIEMSDEDEDRLNREADKLVNQRQEEINLGGGGGSALRPLTHEEAKQDILEKLGVPANTRIKTEERNKEKTGNAYTDAYLELPEYMRSRPSEPGFKEELKRFTEDVNKGTADLNGRQVAILKNNNIKLDLGERGKTTPLYTERYRQFQVRTKDKNIEKEFGDKVFRSKDELEAFNNKLEDFTNMPVKGKKEERRVKREELHKQPSGSPLKKQIEFTDIHRVSPKAPLEVVATARIMADFNNEAKKKGIVNKDREQTYKELASVVSSARQRELEAIAIKNAVAREKQPKRPSKK